MEVAGVWGQGGVRRASCIWYYCSLCYYFPEQKNQQCQWTSDQLKAALAKILSRIHGRNHFWYQNVTCPRFSDEQYGFWIGFIGTSLTFTTNYNSSQSMAALDSLHSLLNYECHPFCRDWLGSVLRVGHFFSFLCPLVNAPPFITSGVPNRAVVLNLCETAAR
jgi:hypothetical protein